MNKLIVLKSPKKHFWESLHQAENHLLQALKNHPNAEFWSCQTEFTADQLNYLQSNQVDLYFLSDSLMTEKLVKQIQHYSNVRYIIATYGNITKEIYRWCELDHLLKNKPVIITAGSDRAKNQTCNLLKNDCSRIVPYPFESKIFKKDLQFHQTNTNYIYAGRITPDKNILELLLSFKNATLFNNNINLYLAGPFFEKSFHMQGLRIDFKKFKELFEELITKSNGKIHYLGELSIDELMSEYLKMDCFISMSTFHDEDFGYAAAQAAYVGLDLLLSNWGGHANFGQKDEMIDVTATDYNYAIIDSNLLTKKLILAKNNNSIERVKKNRAYLSYTNILNRIVDIQKTNFPIFEGMTDTYLSFANDYKKSFPLSKSNPNSSKYFKEIYGSYFETNNSNSGK